MKPKANFIHYITMAPLTERMLSFSLRCLSLHSLVEQRKCQITLIEAVLPARNCNAMKPKANFVHYITMAPLTQSMSEFFPEVPLPTQLNQAKKMSNHHN